jgi:hypothetical protein
VRERVVPEGGQASEASAAVGTSEAADRHGQAVDQGEFPVVPGCRRDAPPERDLDQPKVRGLPRQRGPVHRPQGGEELREVAAEVGV